MTLRDPSPRSDERSPDETAPHSFSSLDRSPLNPLVSAARLAAEEAFSAPRVYSSRSSPAPVTIRKKKRLTEQTPAEATGADPLTEASGLHTPRVFRAKAPVVAPFGHDSSSFIPSRTPSRPSTEIQPIPSIPVRRPRLNRPSKVVHLRVSSERPTEPPAEAETRGNPPRSEELPRLAASMAELDSVLAEVQLLQSLQFRHTDSESEWDRLYRDGAKLHKQLDALMRRRHPWSER